MKAKKNRIFLKQIFQVILLTVSLTAAGCALWVPKSRLHPQVTVAAESLMSYRDICRAESVDLLLRSEVPVEYEKSLPLPTLRWGMPAYASYASSAARVPGQPLRLGSPNRWWLVDARTGHLLQYALCQVTAFSNQSWGEEAIPASLETMTERQQKIDSILLQMDKQSPRFLSGSPGDPGERGRLAGALKEYLPKPIIAQYRSLAPDFFAWLEK